MRFYIKIYSVVNFEILVTNKKIYLQHKNCIYVLQMVIKLTIHLDIKDNLKLPLVCINFTLPREYFTNKDTNKW